MIPLPVEQKPHHIEHETTFAFDAFKGVLVFLILAVRNKCLSINRVAFDVLNMFARIHQHS